MITQNINHMFVTDSAELNAYIRKFAIGADLGADWKVIELKQVEVPPHPQTGERCTMVQLTVQKPGESPLPSIPEIPPPPAQPPA